MDKVQKTTFTDHRGVFEQAVPVRGEDNGQPANGHPHGYSTVYN
jgi:hypothetical protein